MGAKILIFVASTDSEIHYTSADPSITMLRAQKDESGVQSESRPAHSVREWGKRARICSQNTMDEQTSGPPHAAQAPSNETLGILFTFTMHTSSFGLRIFSLALRIANPIRTFALERHPAEFHVHDMKT